MQLEDLYGKSTPLKLESVDMEFELRVLTLDDRIWLKNTYGENLALLLSPDNLDLELLCRLVFRLIVNKSDFVSQDVNIINEDGSILKESIGGYKLLSRMISSATDQAALIDAAVMAINSSNTTETGDDSKKK